MNPTPGINNIFGTVAPLPGHEKIADPATGLGILFNTAVRLGILGAAILMFAYLIWGVYDWIVSGGEQEALSKARMKMTQAVVGMILVVVSLSIFSIVTGDILGIVRKDANGSWIFSLPTINGVGSGGSSPRPSGSACTSHSACQSGFCQPQTGTCQ